MLRSVRVEAGVVLMSVRIGVSVMLKLVALRPG